MLVAFSIVVATVPHRWGRHQARPYLDGVDAPRALAAGVARWIEDGLDEGRFSTGSPRFDGEWLFGTHVMAALGFGQLAMADAARAGEHLARMDRALDAIRSPELRGFDRAAWGRDAFDALDDPRGHVAFLGYYGLALALRRRLGEGPHDDVASAVASALTRRFEASDSGLVETYPREIYPVDNAAGIAAVALHASAVGDERPSVVDTWLERLPRWLDRRSGLLVQAVATDGRTPVDEGRGSGTALAAYFLSFVDRDASRRLYEALTRSCYDEVLGFGAMREYPHGADGRGDIDSGPLVFGYGISATGFALASAKTHGDRGRFEALYATAYLFGAPVSRDDATSFVTGGPLGDAILFAMLTAHPVAEDAP
ncbi:MAG TPA: hypothetical protein ENK57_09155 [Polyangiaceae bacterium]|nr:hypothetical protein [Polyangiaceae bacterium]